LHGAINAQYESEIKNINAVADAKKRVADQDEENRQSFMYGWEKAYREYKYESLNVAKFGAEAFTSVVNNMNTALDKFVRTGKLNFKDLAKSIIQDLISIQLRASAMKMFGGLFSSLFPGGSTGLASLPSSVNRAFADGGSPPVGVPSLVGERGPELFIPNQSGTIVPNNQLAGALGGPSIVYNGPYIANMSAIDTQSATQFIASNKMSIFAANQSAARSLPASR
jgi:phage-related minor tail protein